MIMHVVAAAAITSGEQGRDREPVMVLPLLSFCGLMTVEAIDALLRVSAHLILVHDRVLLLCVAFGALPSRAYELGRGLSRLDSRSRPVDQKGAHNEREGDDDSDEHGSERHDLRILA